MLAFLVETKQEQFKTHLIESTNAYCTCVPSLFSYFADIAVLDCFAQTSYISPQLHSSLVLLSLLPLLYVPVHPSVPTIRALHLLPGTQSGLALPLVPRPLAGPLDQVDPVALRILGYPEKEPVLDDTEEH